jgi:hypothetical protein
MVLIPQRIKFKMGSKPTKIEVPAPPIDFEDDPDPEESDESSLPDEAPRQMTLDHLLGSMPKPELRLMEGNIHKRGMDGALHARYLVLSADALFIASGKDAESIKDCIPLLEVIAVRASDTHTGDLDLVLNSERKAIGEGGIASEEEGGGPPSLAFEIHTRKDGDCSGVSYLFIAESAEACQAWRLAANAALHRLRARLDQIQRISKFTIYQRRARRVYNSMPVQMTVAGLVFLNFLATAAQVPSPMHPRRLGHPVLLSIDPDRRPAGGGPAAARLRGGVRLWGHRPRLHGPLRRRARRQPLRKLVLALLDGERPAAEPPR